MQQELVNDAHDDDFIQGLEADGGVQSVAEFGREQTLDVGQFVAGFTRIGEADGGLVHGFRTRIGGHDDDHVAEVGFAPVVVGQRAVVHHLQQDVEDVGMGFFNLVEQQHGMRFFGDSFGQQPPLVKAHIAGRRTNESADGVAFHVLGHVKPQQVNAQDVSKLFGGFGFANASGAAEQERTNRFVRLAQA